MSQLVGFPIMVILDPYDMTFDAVGVFGLEFWLLFKSTSSYCGENQGQKARKKLMTQGKYFNQWEHSNL